MTRRLYAPFLSLTRPVHPDLAPRRARARRPVHPAASEQLAQLSLALYYSSVVRGWAFFVDLWIYLALRTISLALPLSMCLACARAPRAVPAARRAAACARVGRRAHANRCHRLGPSGPSGPSGASVRPFAATLPTPSRTPIARAVLVSCSPASQVRSLWGPMWARRCRLCLLYTSPSPRD